MSARAGAPGRPTHGDHVAVFKYDAGRWPLREWVERVLGTTELERLHELPLDPPQLPPGPESELLIVQRAALAMSVAEHLRGALDAAAVKLFADFVYEELPPRFGPVLRHQARPVFRVHMDGGHSISGFHRDRDWGQASNVWNLWLPFTDVWGTNGIWIESEEGVGDHAPITLACGEAMVFRGADLAHGSVRNDSGSTRVSCDIRFAIAIN